MDVHRRRLAGLDSFATLTQVARDVHGTTETEEAHETSTIAPYHSALNGVDQRMNFLLKDILWWTLGIMALIILSIRLSEIVWMHLRRISAMSLPGYKQTYWRQSQWHWMPSLKKNLIYAPLWKKRHNREIKLSSAVTIGTLPSRLHALVLGILLGSNFIYMFILNWENENKYAFFAELRGRSGVLSLANMIVLILLAGRNNPLIPLLRISFDTYNLIHRWLGRIVVIEAVIHTIAWAVVQFADGGFGAITDKIMNNLFIGSGAAGTLALIFILIFSLSPVRHAFYETFLSCHIVLAFVVFLCTLIHCAAAEIGRLPQLSWIIGVFVIWFLERLWRMCTIAYVNWSSKGFTDAVIEAMPGECTRVTLNLPRYIDVRPGQHAYLRFASVSPWESHPFSIAWVEHAADSLPVAEKDAPTKINHKHARTSVSFVIGAQTGFTRKLYERARKSGSKKVRLGAACEGPYAGHHSLDSYGHAVLFAGSTGITHQISYLRPLIEGFNTGIVATRRITLVWIVRDFEALEWVRPWMDTILRLPNRKDILRIKLFVTRPKNPREITSASSTVEMFPGRPNILMLLRKERLEQQGAMAVTVCGPGALADDVRSAVREVVDEVTVPEQAFSRPVDELSFIEESFTW